MSTVTTTTTITTTKGKWTSTAGPLQTKKVNKALSALSWRSQSFRQITDHGESILTRMAIGGGSDDKLRAIVNPIGDQFNWTITRENFKQVIAAIEAATTVIELPVEDVRTTKDKRAERERLSAERAKKDAEHSAAVKSSSESILAKKPAWAEAMIVASLHENDSDLMTDYHNHKTTRRVVIGWRRGKKEDFRQLRAAAAAFPETVHLGPGCDLYHVVRYHEPDTGPNCYRPATRIDQRFRTEADAQAWIDAAEARDEAKRAAVPFVGFCPELPFGAKIEFDSIEHRENYSMGAGNYLKAGTRDCDGWCVQSVQFGSLNNTNYEDGLAGPAKATTPVFKAPSVNGRDTPSGWESTTPKQGTNYRIEKHWHSKRQIDFWIIVPHERYDREKFEEIRDLCKDAGGWYSRAWSQLPGGFAFMDEAVAIAWAEQAIG